MAEQFGTEEARIRQSFTRNQERFIEGKHYYKLEGAELADFKGSYLNDTSLKFVSELMLWTERGTARHAKILETDEAWQVYEELEETYFRVKEPQIDTAQLSPQTQLILQLSQSIARAELEAKETKQLAIEAKADATTAKETIKEIKNSLAELPKDQWRKWVNGSLSEIAFKSGNSSQNHEDIRSDSYKLLEDRAGADLSTRVRNGRKRLEESGATKTAIENYRKLDAIEEDKRLKEIYTGIIQKMRIKYLV